MQPRPGNAPSSAAAPRLFRIALLAGVIALLLLAGGYRHWREQRDLQAASSAADDFIMSVMQHDFNAASSQLAGPSASTDQRTEDLVEKQRDFELRHGMIQRVSLTTRRHVDSPDADEVHFLYTAHCATQNGHIGLGIIRSGANWQVLTYVPGD